MKILIIRHAIAEDRMVFAKTGLSDDLRPLTEKGTGRMQEAAQGLKKLLSRIDVLANSPLVRARQTADILGERYLSARRVELQELAPSGEASRVAEHLATLPPETIVAVVGHEPGLSELAAWLLAGEPFGFMALKKGSACLLETFDTPGPSCAELLWALTPKQLRRFGPGLSC